MDHERIPSLPIGVRFRPNQQELLLYLKHRLSGEPLGNDPIAVVDLYDSEPWDLPSKSKLKKEDRKWYFYSRLHKKYAKKSLRINRATNNGQWKVTGPDRMVCYNSRTRGTRKILTFYSRQGRGVVRTNWGMHEYSLGDKESYGNSLVLCKIFLKPHDGSIGGEAPCGEESKEHDDVGVVAPGEKASTEVVVGDGGYVEATNLAQDVNHYGVFVKDYQPPIIGTSQTSELHPDPKFVNIPEQHGMDAEPSIDGFIEARDLGTPMEADSACLGPADNPDLCFDPTELLGLEDPRPHDSQKNEVGGADQVYEVNFSPSFDPDELLNLDYYPEMDLFEILGTEGTRSPVAQKDVDSSWVFVEDYQKPMIGTSQASELHPDQKYVYNQEQYGMVAEPLKDKYFVEPSDCTNAFDNPPSNDEFIEDEDPVCVGLDDDPNMCLDLSEILGTENTRSSVALKNGIVGADQVSEENLFAFDTSEFLNLDDYPDMGLYLSEISGTENTRPPVPQQNEIVGANQVLEAKMDESGGDGHKHA